MPVFTWSVFNIACIVLVAASAVAVVSDYLYRRTRKD